MINQIQMKKRTKLLAILMVIIAGFSLTGCQKSDSSTLFGNSIIYIPESTVSGGQNLHYLVPTGANTDTYNYKVDVPTNQVNVLLGVLRSGMATYETYSVNLSTRSDTIIQLIANGKINLTPSTKPVVLLPATAYVLPSTVTVPDGNAAASYNLSIDLPTLKTYAGKKVALCVAISNPTKYVISSTNKNVIILIDVDVLKLP